LFVTPQRSLTVQCILVLEAGPQNVLPPVF
jgi:hypothetical protein